MRHTSKIFLNLAIVSLHTLALLGCAEKNQEGDLASAHANYAIYDEDGLRVRYPEYWKVAFDTTPSFSEGRILAFETPNTSRISIHLLGEASATTQTLADSYVAELKLESSQYVKNLKSAPIDIAGHTGLRLTWLDTQIGPIKSELTVLEAKTSEPGVFVAFQLFDEDLQIESAHVAAVIENISISK